MLATSPPVAYLHEPFHIHHDPWLCAARFDAWFTYVCEENEAPYVEPIADMLDNARMRAGDAWDRTKAVRPLIKDPIAVFSAGWLASRFETRNVVMIRHPAAFAGSLKARRWTHPFSHFLEQPLLMSHHLAPFADDIRRFADEEQDVVDQAALLWTLIHVMILKYQETCPDWHYVRHEDLSGNPVEGFRSLFDRLDLEFTDEIERTVVAHAVPEASQPAAPARTSPDLVRDSRANIGTWKVRLTPPEIDRVRSRVRDVARHFYSDHEW